MAEFIKAYNEEGDTVFELSVTALNKRLAKTRGLSNLLIRHPGQATALKDVKVRGLGDGFVKDYRVIVTISGRGDVRDVTNIDSAARKVQSLL